MDLAIRTGFKAQNRQWLSGWTADQFALEVETRTVTRTVKALRFAFHSTTKMRTNQAKGAKTFIAMDQDSRYLREQCTRTGWIIRSQAKVKFAEGGRLGLVAEETQETAQSQEAADG